MQQNPEQQPPKTPQEPTEEKLEFLKREEVRTMAKDVARIREQQAAKERERITDLKKKTAPQEPKKPEVVLSQQPSQQQQQQEQPKRTLIPKRHLSSSQKLFIRLLVAGIILLVVFNAAAFGFWYFFKRGAALKPQPQTTQQETQAPSLPVAPEPQPEVQEPSSEPPAQPALPPAPVPAVFFEAPQQELLLENALQLLSELDNVLSGDLAPGFLHLVLKEQDRVLSSAQFLEASSIAMPEQLKEKLQTSSMLFSHTLGSKERLGVVFELTDTAGVSELLLSWEETIEQDTSAFFAVIGRKGSAYTPFFRSATYKGTEVRFQTFSVIDFGIVYGIVGDKLLLASSFESFRKAVDQLQSI